MYWTFSKLVSQTFSVFRLTPGISKSANFNYTAILWLQKVQMDAKVGHQEGRQGREEREDGLDFLEQSLWITCP